MTLNDIKQIVNLLYEEWDLGKTLSKSKGKICAWIYFFEIMEETEKFILEKENGKVIGICAYAKWNSKKFILKKSLYKIIKKLLIFSPFIKDRQGLLSYYKTYDYLPPYLENYFDGEISILIVDKNFRGRGIGKKLILQIFEYAKV